MVGFNRTLRISHGWITIPDDLREDHLLHVWESQNKTPKKTPKSKVKYNYES